MNRAVLLTLTALLAWPLAAAAQGEGKVSTKSAVTGQLATKAKAGESIADARQALTEAWSNTPLSMPVAIFVTAKAGGFGMYDARPTAIFKPGEILYFYVEPQGYKFVDSGNLKTFGVVMDLELTNKAGDVLFHKAGFLDHDFISHHANEEIMLNGDLNITGAKAGDYVILLTLHDKNGTGTASARLPFTIQ